MTIPRLDPPPPLLLALISLSLGTLMACAVVLWDAIVGGPRIDLGDLGPDWWVDRARKGGGGS